MNSSRLKAHIESITGETITTMPYGTGRITTLSGKTFFLKTGNHSRAYQCEANGLKELAKSNAIRVPKIYSVDQTHLLTEYIAGVQPNPLFQQELGRKLARLHRTHSGTFGFYENNFIGANPQINLAEKEEKTNWATFYFNKRLLYQYHLAEQNGYATTTLNRGMTYLENNIHQLLANTQEPPTLIHGDLWSGNYLCTSGNQPVLIDPAVYYGHREAELAMTKVFGGFSPHFYSAYQKEYPLPDGWQHREALYKLYHILNHLNLFGRTYLSEAEHLISTYTVK